MDFFVVGLVLVLAAFFCLCLAISAIELFPDFQFRVVIAGKKRSLYM